MNAAAQDQDMRSFDRCATPGDAADAGAKRGTGRRSPLTLGALLRQEAKVLVDWTLNAEFDALLAQHASVADRSGRAAYVRNGHQPARELLTNLGPVDIRIPKVRSRIEPRLVFRSALARPYQRRARVAVEQAPALFLMGWGSGNLHGAIRALMGPEAAALPAAVMRRLAERWRSEREPRLAGTLEGLRFDALWLQSVDSGDGLSRDLAGVMLAVALRDCAFEQILAVVPLRDAAEAGWVEVLRALRARGLPAPRALRGSEESCGAIAAAAAQVYPQTALGSMTAAERWD